MFICDVSLLHRYGKEQLDQELCPLGVKWQDAIVILVVYGIPQVNLSMLSSMLQTHKGNVSKLLRRMEERGLIARQVLQEDGRKKELVLTEDGSSLVHQINNAMDSWEKQCFAGLTSQEIETYHQLNRKIVTNLYPYPERIL